jgi:ribonuclease Z
VKFELTILGSSSALPTSKRFPTAQVLNVLERFFLIDCGEGTQIQLRKYKVPYGRLNHIFISHLHGDHIFGLIGLISSFSLQGRTNDLHIYAHRKLEELIRFQLECLDTKLSYELVFHPIFGKEIQTLYEDKVVEVQCFPLKHGPMPCAGFLFKEKDRPRNLIKEMVDFYRIPIRAMASIKAGEDFVRDSGEVVPNGLLTKNPPRARSYAFCTDTAYLEKIVPVVQGVDLLYHEATFLKIDEKRAKKTYHSTAEQAARIAHLANVGKLIIGHFSARFKEVHEHLAEARAIFPNTEAGNDGAVFSIEVKK